jgi:type I restriction enzyme M protein
MRTTVSTTLNENLKHIVEDSLFGYDIDVTTMVRLVDEPDDARRPTQY